MCGTEVTLFGDVGRVGGGDVGEVGEVGEVGRASGATTFSSPPDAGTSLYLKFPFPSSRRTSFQGHSEGRVGLNDSLEILILIFY
jgi:hypothetical protein